MTQKAEIIQKVLGIFLIFCVHGYCHSQATGDEKPVKPVMGETINLLKPNDNPFYSDALKPGYAYHPFFDYSSVHGKFPDDIKLDYFGFRNDRNLYFDEDRDYILVLLTSGSEGAGFSHKTTVAEHLEVILNTGSGREVRVLNLAVNSYCISQEISTYVHLAWHLKPEVVISLCGWNDMTYSQMVPLNFKKLGLAYPNFYEGWSATIHPVKPARENIWTPMEGSDELITECFLKNIEKYRTLVETNGGKFLMGLQGFVEEDKDVLPIYPRVYSLMKQLSVKIRDRDYAYDFTVRKDMEFVDPVHSNDVSSRLIAETFAPLVAKTLGLRLD
jgi:hypothetical protein